MAKNITCLGLGFGSVANLHNKKLGNHGVEMIGVVDPNPAAQQKARDAGLMVYGSVAEAPRPDFYDIRVSTANHLEALSQVLGVTPDANILMEKPIVQFSDLAALAEIRKAHSAAKLVVNENYTLANGTQLLKSAIGGRDVESVIINMSKHRGHQMIPGEDGKARFFDKEAGAFGYEGPHMLTILHHLGEDYMPRDISNADLTDMVLTEGKGYRFDEQGTAWANFTGANDVPVKFYTSMEGKVKDFMGPYAPTRDIKFGEDKRHRILAVQLRDGTEFITTYEPTMVEGRGVGAFTVINPGAKPVTNLTDDDTMGTHLGRVADYFRNGGVNPCPAENAVSIVRAQELLVGAARMYRGKN